MKRNIYTYLMLSLIVFALLGLLLAFTNSIIGFSIGLFTATLISVFIFHYVVDSRGSK